VSEHEQEQSANAEPERPDWLPDNFTKPEDLVGSYQQLQAKLREQGTEKNQALETVQELQARLETIEQQQQALQWQTHQNSLAEQWEMAEPTQQLQIAAAIAQEAAERKFQELQAQSTPQTQGSPQYADMAVFLARQAMEQKHPDWEAVAPKIGEIVQADPALFPVTASDGLETIVSRLDNLYMLAKARQSFEQGGSALSDLAVAAAQAKQQASTISGTNGPQVSNDDYWEAVKNADPGGYR